MKKILVIMSAVVLALVTGCKKPAPADTLTLVSVSSTAPIVKEGTDDPIVITFAATKAWKASVNSTEFATVTPKSGEAGELNKVKLNVAENETMTDREIVVTLASEGVEPVQVKFTQYSQYHMIISQEEFSAPVKGGEYTFSVDANVKFEMKDYADKFTWMHVVPGNGNDYKVTIDANATYDERTSYIKFTTSEIQVPVLDEEGNETGETEDLAIRVYFYQEGNAIVDFKAIPDNVITGNKKYSLAFYKGDLYMCNGETVYSVNKNTVEVGGRFEAIPDDAVILEIFNDDASNLLAVVDAGDGAIAVIHFDSTGKDNLLFVTACTEWCAGFGNFTAKGDVTKDGIITCMGGGYPSYGGIHFGFYWDIKGGSTEPTAKWIQITDIAKDIWVSTRAAFSPLGTSSADGFVYGAYDDAYDIKVYKNENWTTAANLGSWLSGVSSIKAINWNSKDYLVLNEMSWFPAWGASMVHVYDMAANELLTSVAFPYEADNFDLNSCEPTSSIACELDGADLVIYSVVAAEFGSIERIKLPVL